MSKKIQDAVETGLSILKGRGYINYYGLQRFGTHAISTHLLGMKILSGDFEGVVDDILHVEDHLVEQVLSQAAQQPTSPVPNDEFDRARAITTWKMTKNVGVGAGSPSEALQYRDCNHSPPRSPHPPA